METWISLFLFVYFTAHIVRKTTEKVDTMKKIEELKQWVDDHREHVSVALVSSGVTMVVIGTAALIAVVKNDNQNSGARHALQMALPGSKLILPFKNPDGTNIVLSKTD